MAVVAVLLALVEISRNKQQVVRLKQQATQTDQGNGDTKAALSELQSFAANHTSASATIELTDSYKRAVAASSSSGTGQVYAQAQAACASHADSIVQARCVSSYLANHAQMGGEAQPVPEESKYVYSYKSPVVAPDSAGLSLLVAVAAFGAALWATGLKKS